MLLADPAPPLPFTIMSARKNPQLQQQQLQQQKLAGARVSPRNLRKLDINKDSSPSSGIPSSPNNLSLMSPDSPIPSKKPKKGACPCGRSSSGRDWLVICSENNCKQHWHTSCANLKGANPLSQAQVDNLTKQWLCPWCYTVPFAKPGNHSSTLNEISLIEKALSSAAYQNITDSITDLLKSSPPAAIDLTNMETRLEELTKEVKDFKESSLRPFVPNQTPNLCTPTFHEKRTLDCKEKAYECYRENFLGEDDFGSINDLLGYLKDNGSFIPERGHEVILYGEPYSYTGSKNLEPDPIPPELNKVIDLFASEFSLSESERPNSVLINYFPGNNGLDVNETHLAMHSDDESSILADSKIFTLSVGASRKIVFERKHSSETMKEDLEVSNNSVYIMSRRSQNWFRHGVPAPPPGDVIDERFSVTFRCLQKQFNRSILLIGDSNTKEVNFGSGTGKVGQSYPGKRMKAAKVKDIDPKECVGYSNIFIMCGTNDLRCEYISDEQDIHCVVDTLKDKLIQVKQLCPRAKIFCIPVMPSRIPKMNHFISLYNGLVDEMLSINFPDIWFQGIYDFVDRQGLLDSKLIRQNDKIHLGKRGIAKLVRYLKVCVFRREKYETYILGSSQQESTLQVGLSEPT